MLNDAVQSFVRQDVLERFVRYVRIHTTSDESSSSVPSTAGQMDLLRLLAEECQALGLDTQISDRGYVLATLPPRDGAESPDFGLLAHVDTSPEQPGDDVKPVCHEDWDGEPIRYTDDPELLLSPEDCPELDHFRGDTIVTASGATLLGADDKAGVAEIMTALAALRRFDDLPHGRIVACFTTDEEIGRGTEGLDHERLPRFCYTMDGGYPGELQAECFDAWRADIHFKGIGVHPGVAKDKLVHAGMIGARFLAALPELESPEHTDGRDGFYYLSSFVGDCENASAKLIIRDFEAEKNAARRQHLEELRARFLERYPRLEIDLHFAEQYRNMRDHLDRYPDVVEKAEGAIRDTGLKPIRKPIRGGTDGSLLTELGHPTPNIFAGGMLAHSRREWIAHQSLAQATETILHLARRWSTQGT